MTAPGAGPTGGGDGWWRLGELFAATGFVIAQPLLSVFGRSPDTFIFHGASGPDIVAFALTVALLPPIVIWTAELVAARRSEWAARALHVGALGGLGALMGVQIAKRALSWGAGAAVASGLVLGALTVVTYLRARPARTWLRCATPAPAVFLVLFLGASPVSGLVAPEAVGAADIGAARGSPSVVMVVFDEWPTASFVGADGRVDAALFPNLARLAGTSTWYRNATTVTNSTWHAVPSLLTGRYPEESQVPDAATHPRNLFTFLGGSYRLEVSEVVSRLCPRDLCDGSVGGGSSAPGTGAAPGGRPPDPTRTSLQGLLADAARTYRDIIRPSDRHVDVTQGFREPETDAAVEAARGATAAGDRAPLDLADATSRRPERFVRFLRSIERDEEPTVHFLHVLIPHVAYRYLPSGLTYDSPPGNFGKTKDAEWTDEAWPPALAHQRMLLQAAYVDRLVGELLDRLRSTGQLDRSVVVVTADHGMAFTPGENARGLGDETVPPSLYPQVLWAPLFVKASGQTTGEMSDADVMSIDVLPTVARLVGFRLPWKVDGLPAGERGGSRKTFVWAHHNPFGVGIEPAVTFDGRRPFRAMLAGNVDAVTDPADPALQLFRIGPEGRLVGRAVSSVARGDPARSTAKLAQLVALGRVDKASGAVPAMAWGRLDHDATVVLAVNGTIAGVSPTFRDGDVEHRFAMMIPDRLLRDGANRVELFERRGDPGRDTLHRLEVADGD